jgi:hypothetical protein
MTVRSILREPLLHFLVLGALLFVLGGVLGGDPGPGSTDIIVSEGKIEQLAEAFRRTWQRPPTEPELYGLVEDFIKEEIFYREALAMGLEEDDAVIRRRLRQKMEFFTQDLAFQADPTQEELQQYLQANSEKYRRDGRVSFLQVFFNANRRGDATLADARALLERIQDRGAEVDLAELGDPIMLGNVFQDVAESDVERLFGRAFADTVMQLDTARWVGPVESGYGLHLVFVRDRVAGVVPPLSDVVVEVRRDVLAERQRTLNEEVYQRFRERYDVRVDWPEWVEPDTAVAERP